MSSPDGTWRDDQNELPARKRRVVEKTKAVPKAARPPTDLSCLVSSTLRTNALDRQMSYMDLEDDDAGTSLKDQNELAALSTTLKEKLSAFNEANEEWCRISRSFTGSIDFQEASRTVGSGTSSELQGFYKALSERTIDFKSLSELQKDALELMKEAVSRKEGTRIRLQVDKEKAEKKCKELEGDLASRESLLKESEEAKCNMANDLQAAQSRLSSLGEVNRGLHEALDEEKLRSKQLEDKGRAELTSLDKKYQVVRQQWESTSKESAYRFSSLQDYERKVESLEQKMQSISDERKLEAERLQTDINMANKRIKIFKSEKAALGKKRQEEKQSSDDQVGSLKRSHAEQLHKSEQTIARLKRDLEEFKAISEEREAYFERKVSDLEKNNDSLNTQWNAMHSTIEKLRSRSKTLESELGAKNTEHDDLLVKFNDLTRSHQGCHGNHQSLQQALEAQKNQHETAILSERTDVAEELKAVLHISSKLPLGMLQRFSLSTERVSVLDKCNSENNNVLSLYGRLKPKEMLTGVGGLLDAVLRIALLAGGPCSRKLTDLLWAVWGTIEFGRNISVQDRQVLAMPLISLVRKLFQPSESVPQIALWMGCQIACLVLAWLPSNVDLVEAIDFANLKEATPLVLDGCHQLTVQDHRRRLTPPPTLNSLMDSGIPHPDVDVFPCRYGSLRTMAYTHWASGEITFAINTRDGSKFLWHHEISQCAYFERGFTIWLELSGGIDGDPIYIECIDSLRGGWHSMCKRVDGPQGIV